MKQEKTKKNSNEDTSKFSREDINKAVAGESEILKVAGKLKKLYDDAKTLIMMLKDHKAGIYKELPSALITATVVALLYVLSPFDLVPDTIPFLGLTDDAAVVAAVFAGFASEIDAYRKWKRKNKTSA